MQSWQMHAFVIIISIAVVFLPAMLLLYLAWSEWLSNKRPEIARWRLATFRWGLICTPAGMALVAPGAGNYIWTWGPAGVLLGTTNLCGLLLLLISLAVSFTGSGKGRLFLCSGVFLAILGLLAIYNTYP